MQAGQGDLTRHQGGPMPHTAPVRDWATDFDVSTRVRQRSVQHLGRAARQRARSPHTDRRKSSWLPTRYDDVTAIAHDIAHFSSLKVAVIPGDEDEDPEEFDGPNLEYGLPPISADPPAAHLDPPAPAPVVLPQAGRQLRAHDPRALPRPARRFADDGPGRCRRRLRAADPGAGHRPHPGRARPTSPTPSPAGCATCSSSPTTERRASAASKAYYFLGSWRTGAGTRATTC